MEISKKDLLKETNISYGQLYRWKREGLIPEEWFIKRSSYTGQETFFPKEEILERVSFIQKNKDDYSLDELAKMLEPTKFNREFDKIDIRKIGGLNNELIQLYSDFCSNEYFSFIEVLALISLSRIIKEQRITLKAEIDWFISFVHLFKTLDNTKQQVLIVQIDGKLFTILVEEQKNIILDEQVVIIEKINLQEVAKDFKLKYQSVFHFA